MGVFLRRMKVTLEGGIDDGKEILAAVSCRYFFSIEQFYTVIAWY